MEYPTSHLYFSSLKASVYIKEIQVTSVYNERALHNGFVPCNRKCSGQHNQCDIRGGARCEG